MTEPSHLWYLENFNLLKVLSDEEKQAIHERSFVIKLAKGKQLPLTGHLSHHIFLLKEGKIKFSRYAEDGRELIVGILEQGEVFGELCLVSAETDEVACALEDSIVCKVHKDDLRQILEKSAAFSLEVTKLVGLRLLKLRNRLEDLYFKSAEERVRVYIKELSQTHGSRQSAEGPVVIKLSLKHDDIAKLTATNRQKVCAVFSELEKQGIITYNRKQLFVHKPDAL